VDQAANKDKLWSYQGILCLTDSGYNQGGFVVVPGSHKYHRKYFVEKGMANFKENWYLIPE
jgi:ectoine hydroxylase-related dioxygenase (phytanoyl-CoA dioxygenase family)